MAITREQILAEIKRRQESKAVVKPAAKIVKETTKAATKPVVVKETKRTGRAETITENLRKRTASMNSEQKRSYTLLAENIIKATRTVYGESTQAGPGQPNAVGNGAGLGLVKTYFDIFFGYFPELIVNEIASVQPIATQRAVIFYYQTLAGSDKGAVRKGDVLIDPFKINTDIEYTSDRVTIAKNTPAATWNPVIPSSVVVEGFDLTWSDADTFTGAGKAFMKNGVLVDNTGKVIAGTVTANANTIQVDITGTDAADVTHVTYAYDNIYAPTQTPDLNANVAEIDVTAKARTVKTNYSFQAGFAFEAQFGQTLEDKLAENAMYELKRETDLDFVFEVMNAAPEMVVWNKAAGVANGLYEFHKLSFQDAVIKASNRIFAKSKRARGNILLVGINAQTIVETLPGFTGIDFGVQLGGAKVIGNLKGIKVIAIPELGANDWAVIYKDGKDNLDAGIVFAPYIPVVATPTVMLDDFMARKAYTTSYGKVVVNADYFVRGTIVDNPVAQPVVVFDKNGQIIEEFGLDGN